MDSLNYPNFLPEEIDLLLNNAQERFIKQRYGLTNTKRQSFEETEKRTEDLKNITINAIITPLAYSVNNLDTTSRFFTVPLNHWFTIQERATISCLICGATVSKKVEVLPTGHLEISKNLKDPFRKPNSEKVLRLMFNGQAELFSSCTLIDYNLRYIRQPVSINLSTSTTCELSDHTHSEIIDIAVGLALEGIEGKRTQTFNPLVNNTNE